MSKYRLTHVPSLGTIQTIEEVQGVEIPESFTVSSEIYRYVVTYDGYRIVTDQHIILALIANDQQCCESWGYFSSDDDAAFVGASLQEVRLTDTALNQASFDQRNLYLDDGRIQFIDFVTDRGVFQVAVYNGHNGYYGHSVVVRVDDADMLDTTI